MSSTTSSANSALPQFDTSFYISQIFWLIVSFLILVLFVKKVIVPRVTKVTNDRRQYINNLEESINTVSRENEDTANRLLSIKNDTESKMNYLITNTKKETQQNILLKTSIIEKTVQHNISIFRHQIEEEIKNNSNLIEKELKNLSCSAFEKLIQVGKK